MGVTLNDSVRRDDWLLGREQNDKAIKIQLTNTNPSGTDQKTAVTVADAGTSGKTTVQLEALISRTILFATDGTYKGQADDKAVTLSSSGSTDIIAVCEFDNLGYAVPGYRAGYT